MIGKMLENYTSDAYKDITHNGQGYLQEALGRLVEYKTQTTEMLERVGATRGDVSSNLSFIHHASAPYIPGELTPPSMRNSSRWPNAKPKSTMSAGRGSKLSSPAARTSR